MPEDFTQHHDTMIRYLTGNQDYQQPIHPDTIPPLLWESTWNGNNFKHTPGPGVAGVSHSSDYMQYLTWDGSCWQARWDAGTNQFRHTRLVTGATHQDDVINYLTWDRTKWSAVRDGNQFVHIYVAGAENEIPWEKKLVEVITDVGDVIQVLLKALPKK